ncbi:hypothetical protein AMATHDRAFT_127121, partial [Amanita thiersii Skay4041]
FVQSLFCGFYITTFIQCVRWLAFSNDGWTLRDNTNRPLLAITCCIFVLTITNLFLFCAIAISFLNQQDHRTGLFKLILAPIETLTIVLADSILIYRCWVVNSRRWRIIVLPITLWLSYICFSVLFIYSAAPHMLHPEYPP